ncbi:hypothetical protein [Enterovirga rhinocerotis]|uniref:hypothetical protein n=1 Tax=Enterovirga rhinocerotis TaxID=1339210 RepID=UPI0010619FEF|nr:hypothetical protein [Enterovirga rhinocerotis]
MTIAGECFGTGRHAALLGMTPMVDGGIAKGRHAEEPAEGRRLEAPIMGSGLDAGRRPGMTAVA